MNDIFMFGKQDTQLNTQEPYIDMVSLFTDTYYARAGIYTTRINFGEIIVPGKTKWHTALCLPTPDAMQLAQMLIKLCEQSQKLLSDLPKQ
jgi:hypothetical protein